MARHPSERTIDESAFSECRRIVGQAPDYALALTFAPAARRDDLAALYAFDAEIRAIRDRISDPMPGEIRLQWWRDALTGEGSAGGHPVAEAVLSVIRRYRLPIPAFDRMLEARIFDLYDDPMESRADFEGYAGETDATLIVLAARVLDEGGAENIGDAAGHAGVATAVAEVLHRLPLHRSRGQCYVPTEVLSAVGSSREAFLSGQGEVAGRAVEAMAAFGREHDAAWRRRLPDIPRTIRAAFVPAALARGTIDRAAKAGHLAFERSERAGPLSRSFAAWRIMRR